MTGSAVYGETVVVVQVNDGNVQTHTGRIVSDGTNAVMGDNRLRTRVWGDREFTPFDPLEDGHEKEFQVDDIHLLKREEAKAIAESKTAAERFSCIYEDWVVSKIQRALKKLKL